MEKIKLMKIITTIIFLAIFLIIQRNAKANQQSNFNIMPSPIPYPFFEPNRYDLKIDGSFVNITATDLTLSGGLADLKGRFAFLEYLAIDGEFGLAGFSGTMTGIPPLTSTLTSNGTPYIYSIALLFLLDTQMRVKLLRLH